MREIKLSKDIPIFQQHRFQFFTFHSKNSLMLSLNFIQESDVILSGTAVYKVAEKREGIFVCK